MHTLSQEGLSALLSNVVSKHSPSGDPLLRLRVVRGPLSPAENETILAEYNRRIPPPKIPMQAFLRWVQDGPNGPAWHAILESDSDGIVGHQCFIPLRANYHGHHIVGAKSEYTFLHEDFRTARIRGFEETKRPTHIVAANQLARRCQSEGWDPLLISTIPSLSRRGFYGFMATKFLLWECLLILRPIVAARETPSLPQWQRICFLLGGAVQKTVSWPAALFPPDDTDLRSVCIDGEKVPSRGGPLSFFEELDSLRWRYPRGDYERLELGATSDYIIYKKGAANQYMRVCQWSLDYTELAFSRIARLIRIAQKDGAMGVRWAIYGEGNAARAHVQRLRRAGFLCARRTRILQIKSQNPDFLIPENWDLTDTMFSFHS